MGVCAWVCEGINCHLAQPARLNPYSPTPSAMNHEVGGFAVGLLCSALIHGFLCAALGPKWPAGHHCGTHCGCGQASGLRSSSATRAASNEASPQIGDFWQTPHRRRGLAPDSHLQAPTWDLANPKSPSPPKPPQRWWHCPARGLPLGSARSCPREGRVIIPPGGPAQPPFVMLRWSSVKMQAFADRGPAT